jgi:AraC family transcriptional regulator of adaptative response/methylated-DNA-[protein]-cysteine methyltransferase
MTKATLPDPETAWGAVTRRDHAWDGQLFYGVTSTGVFCRPSCASRRPRRDRVQFFSRWEEAEAAGFRACKRCRPKTAAGPTATEQLVQRTLAHLEGHPDGPVRLSDLARAAGVSAWHLQRTFKKALGLSPREYAAARRAERLRSGLRREGSVSRATYEAGFGSSSRVYESAHRLLGMTPGAFRKGGAGMEIRYTIVASPYGKLLVAATDRGVCAVMLGDQDASLEKDLRAQFPQASRTRVDEGDGWLEQLVARVAEQVKRPGALEDIPLDLSGTAFQWRVWQALATIPAGETRTYQQVARAVGKPRAIRAVASACAANRLAVVVPCHRVIRSDGSLGGYRWGLPRKAALLAGERAAAS